MELSQTSSRSKTIALTGGTGFLGYHLIFSLLEANYRVLLLKRKGSFHPLMKTYPKGVEALEIDFTDEAALTRACDRAASVIHAAGLVSYDNEDQTQMFEVHVELTRRMIRCAQNAGVQRFVHVSSIVTIGHGFVPRNEESPFNAQDLGLAYWTTKYEAERIALAANAPGFEVVVVNPGSLLGEGEKNNQLLPFVKKLARSERPFLPDGGSDFLDVRDGAKGTLLALEKGRPGERYILGSVNLTYRQFHEKLRKVFDLRSRPRMVPRWALSAVEAILRIVEKVTGLDFPVNSARLRRVNGIYMFHHLIKARQELGYTPAPLDRAIRAMVEE
ncbi:MAG: NAD-dependent epimerase/dehydratase family protein [Bdellovibrionota bacterium]